jgi:hypothetical protein
MGCSVKAMSGAPTFEMGLGVIPALQQLKKGLACSCRLSLKDLLEIGSFHFGFQK